MAKVGSRPAPQRNKPEGMQPKTPPGAGNWREDETADLGSKEAHRVQQRAAREAAARARARKQRTREIARIGGAVLGVAILVGIVLIVSHQGNGTVPIGMQVASEGSSSHVPDGSTLTFKHYPPASGHHYPSPASAGFSAKAIPEGNWVHSLEHGYVVILYKPTASGAPSEAQLRDIMATFPKEKHGSVKIVITPYDHMDSPITAVAWERQLSLDQFDRDQLLQFYNAYVDHGPEDVP